MTSVSLNASARMEYKKIKKVLEYNPRIFRPCEIKEFEKGVFRRAMYLVHFDGKRWDILKIAGNNVERYLLE